MEIERLVVSTYTLERAMNLPEGVKLTSIERQDGYSNSFIFRFATDRGLPKGELGDNEYRANYLSEIGDIFRTPEKHRADN